MTIVHLVDSDNDGHSICGEVINDDNSSFVESLTTCEKCLNSLIYVNFGDVSRRELGLQCQHGSQYINGSCGRVNLGKGLRFINVSSFSYHAIRIHKDDVEEFVSRYKQHMKELASR